MCLKSVADFTTIVYNIVAIIGAFYAFAASHKYFNRWRFNKLEIFYGLVKELSRAKYDDAAPARRAMEHYFEDNAYSFKAFNLSEKVANAVKDTKQDVIDGMMRRGELNTLIATLEKLLDVHKRDA